MTTSSRRSASTTLIARFTLAAFLTSLWAPAAHAQVMAGAAKAAAAGSAAAASAAAAAPRAMTMGSSAGLSTSLFSAAAPANSAAAAPSAAAAAVAAPAAAAPSAAMPAAAAIAADPANGHARPQGKLTLPKSGAAAKAALAVAAQEMVGDPARAGNKTFDGAGNRSGGNDGGAAGGSNGGGKSGPPAFTGPKSAPIIHFKKLYFPGVHRVTFEVDKNSPVAGEIRMALAQGGFLVASTPDSKPDGKKGTIGVLMRVTEPREANGGVSVKLEAFRVVRIMSTSTTADNTGVAKIEYPAESAGDGERLGTLAGTAKALVQQFSILDSKMIPADLVRAVMMEENANRMPNLLAQELPFPIETRLRLLASPSDEIMMQEVILETMAMLQNSRVAKTAQAKLTDGKDGGPADPYDSLETFNAKLKIIGMPKPVQETAVKEYEKYKQMNPKDSEAQKMRSYLDWLIDVPWSNRSTDVFDIAKARTILDADHAGLEMVKERVLEFLAVRKKTGSLKGAIICFVGPPGTGKTSIAGDIARSVGRAFVRLSLGGVSDEHEIRGHGRTYVGSMPGAVIRKMKEAGTVNPVFLLDEVDKIGRNGNQGDPTAALLELLDPEQNNTYRDRYMDVPYDMSETLFIVTANDISSIPEPLRDRMEIIEFSGYTPFEKEAIAMKHLVPEMQTKAGLKPNEGVPTSEALRAMIDGYTRESGVRKLRQVVEGLMRKISAWTETRGEAAPAVVDKDQVEKYLGVAPFHARSMSQNGVGLATGLAVSGHGGSTINVEVSVEAGTGQLTLRKQFGDDIDDSAHNALKFVKNNKGKYGIPADYDFSKIDLDINFTPAGKIDGPSAGSLMVTAIISAITNRPVKAGVAMTGEISGRSGRVMPIGGLLQKTMAAHRMGYTTVIHPAENDKDKEQIPSEVKSELKMVSATTYDDVYKAAFDHPAE